MSTEENAEYAEKTEKSEQSDKNTDDILEQIARSLAVGNNEDKQVNISFDNAASPVNMIVNLGAINGNIFQRQNENQEKNANRRKLCLEKDKDFGKFIKEYKNSSVLSAMLVTAVLEIVPENLFPLLCQQFEQCLGRVWGQEEEEYPKQRYDSIKELLSVIKAEKIGATLRRSGGEIPIQCIVYSDPAYPEWIRTEIWADYLEIKEAVTDWICIVRDNPDVSDIYYQIVTGSAALARLDYVYGVQRFINSVEMPWKAYEISYMVKVFEALYSRKEYKKQVEQQMCDWLKRNDPHWRIAYQFYMPESSEEWTELLKKKLISVLQKDKLRQEYAVEAGNWTVRGYLIVPAQLNLSAARILTDVLAEIFEKARVYDERGKAATNYLLLFRDDYFFTNGHQEKMALIDVCNSLDIRKRVRNMLLFIWHTKKYRDVLFDILGHHIEAWKDSDGWEYMQWFLKTLAFTGKAQDFQIMQYLLEKNGSKQAKQIAGWLNNLLRERMEKKIDQNNV